MNIRDIANLFDDVMFRNYLICSSYGILFLLYNILYQYHVHVSILLTTEKNYFTTFTQSNILCVHSEYTQVDKMILIPSDPRLLCSTESSKPQSPSKRLSVSRGIKQLFQSATKFVRLLQRQHTIFLYLSHCALRVWE